jgi:hypothetical protein
MLSASQGQWRITSATSMLPYATLRLSSARGLVPGGRLAIYDARA